MFRYLNLDNAWPSLNLDGLVNNVGILHLAQVPGGGQQVGPALSGAAGLTGPAGIGVDAAGNAYFADPTGNRVLRWDACSEQTCPLPCFGEAGSLPGQLQWPRGVLLGPRRALYVADSGNHRIQVVDVRTLALRAIWGQPDPYAPPTPSGDPGRFNDPWDLAADAAGAVYVADHGNRRVQKFDAAGRVDPGFWTAMAAQPVVPGEPAYVAIALIDRQERLLVLDRSPARVLVYQLDGSNDAGATDRWSALALTLPAGIVFTGDTLYVGEGQSGQALAFDAQGTFLGAARYTGPVAGLALDTKGRLYVHPGGSGAVTQLLPGQAYVESGSFVAGPFSAGSRPVRWGHVQAIPADMPLGAQIRFFTWTGNPGDPAPPPPDAAASPSAADGPNLTGPGVWRAAPAGNLEFLALHEPAAALWLGAVFQGNGTASPALDQVRIAWDEESWLHYLPVMYARDDPTRTFLERALALFRDTLGSVDVELDSLPALFDPGAAPDKAPAPWLDWLASWLAFSLDEDWTPDQRRQALEGAFALLGRRGTAEGLRDFISLYTGASASIDEPSRHASVWSLGEISTLGFTTMLAEAEAQGAVLGTTATLDRSHLLEVTDYGAPLFEDLAHHFCVRVRSMDVMVPGALDRLRRVIEQEKPAHTTYDLCVVEPRMSVGLQARLGVDSIVGGPPPELALGDARQLGVDTALAGSEPGPGQTLGRDARTGSGTSLA